MVAVYLFCGSMPNSGLSLNFCVLGADPSSEGKGKGMRERYNRTARQPSLRARSTYDGVMSDAPSSMHGTPIDLDRVESDLAGVETALARLDDGTYWTCEVTGAEIPDATLAADPTARRVS
jgi:RNA polymerase-binding transcription factor DksA